MVRHRGEPLAADGRALDARHHINGESGQLAIADASLDRIELGARHRVERTVEPQGHRAAQLARWGERQRTVILLRMARQEHAVGAHQRKEIAGAAPDQTIELLEVVRQDGDRDDAVERAVGRGPAPRQGEEGAVQSAPARHQRLAHQRTLGSGRRRVVPEIGSVGNAQVVRDGRKQARRQWFSSAVDHRDRLELGYRVHDPLQPVVQALLVGDDDGVGHAAHYLLDLGDRPLAGLEDLERMLVDDIERMLDAVVGNGMLVPVAEPGCEHEQHRRQHDRRDHHQLQQPDGRLPGRAHLRIIS